MVARAEPNVFTKLFPIKIVLKNFLSFLLIDEHIKLSYYPFGPIYEFLL